jgi:hypothetical protein
LTFSCCDSAVALPAFANYNERRGAAGNGRKSRSITCKKKRLPVGDGLGTMTKYLRRTTSGAAGCGLGTTIKYLVNQNAGAGKTLTKAHYTKASHEFR